LADHRVRLARISTSLAFAYVAFLLETKSFPRRGSLAQDLETAFLRRYFGSDPKIPDFARSLIFNGHKAAAKALNELVDVMGSEVDASRLLKQIYQRFDDLPGVKEEQSRRDQVTRLIQEVSKARYYDSAAELARLLGDKLHETSAGLFSGVKVAVTTPAGQVLCSTKSRSGSGPLSGFAERRRGSRGLPVNLHRHCTSRSGKAPSAGLRSGPCLGITRSGRHGIQVRHLPDEVAQ
jgi:hypothetical protein